jgi:hypothetical protein
MHNVEAIYFFIYVFAILFALKNAFKVVSALLQKNPKPLEYSNRELISLGATISYILTYLIYK